MLLATCPTSRSFLIMLMNKAVRAILPPLMSPCICLYGLILRTGRITQLKLKAFRPSCPHIFSSLNLLSILIVLPPSTHSSDPLTLLFYSECNFWFCRRLDLLNISFSTLESPDLFEAHKGTLRHEQGKRGGIQHSIK